MYQTALDTFQLDSFIVSTCCLMIFDRFYVMTLACNVGKLDMIPARNWGI